MPFMKKGRHAPHGIKSARPRWLTLLVALGLFAALMPMSAAFADSPDTLPWTAATNDPSYWEAWGLETHSEVWSCTKEDNDADVPGGYTLGAPPAGSEWRLLVVKAGSDINDLIWDPVVGTTYEHSIQGGWSHVILCSVEVPLELQVVKEWDGDVDEIDLDDVTVTFTIAVNGGTATEGAGPVDVEDGDSVVITELATGLPDNCSYESDLDEVSPYTVDPDDANEDDLITLTVTNTVDCVNVPQGLLSVDKTAEATFDRDHDWSILKLVDPAVVNLSIDGEGDATVTWNIDVTYEGFIDSGHEVTGTITITNDEPKFDARIDSVIDDLGGELDCDFPDPATALPVTLAADGGELVCDYSLTGVTEDGTNTVSVTGELIDIEDATNVYPIDETGSANFSFALDEETDETVVVSDLSALGDLLGGAGYTLEDLTLHAADYAADDVINFTYSLDFAYEDYGQEDCGDHTYGNTATVTGDEENDTDDASVDVNVQCLIFQGETAWAANGNTPGVFRYNNRGGNWATYVQQEGKTTTLFAGQFYDAGDVTLSAPSVSGLVTITIDLDEPWEFGEDGSTLHVQTYANAPSGNPAPGQFAYTAECPDDPSDPDICTIVVPNANYYGIHVGVGQWVPDPNFPPAV
ncbi:MAG: hypothetical protein ACRDWF_15305 [Acidimicrobiia bacterium]